MKLSEAILLGSIGTNQGFGGLIDKQGRTCALGAALVAIGGIGEDFVTDNVINSQGWAWIQHIQAKCPCGCVVYSSFIIYIITHLNDHKKWTRPQIAAWVASLEEIHGLRKVEPIVEAECVTR